MPDMVNTEKHILPEKRLTFFSFGMPTSPASMEFMVGFGTGLPRGAIRRIGPEAPRS